MIHPSYSKSEQEVPQEHSFTTVNPYTDPIPSAIPLNHRHWRHLMNKLIPYCKQAKTAQTSMSGIAIYHNAWLFQTMVYNWLLISESWAAVLVPVKLLIEATITSAPGLLLLEWRPGFY